MNDKVDRLVSLWTTSGKRWLYVRILSIICGVPAGFLAAWREVGPETAEAQIAFCVIALLFPPVALPLVLSIQVGNPLSRPKWRRPSWFLNPFTLREPLQIFHLEAFECMAIGFGALLAFPFSGYSAVLLAIALALLGVGTWLGVRLCMAIFRRKMEGSVENR